MVPQSIEYAFSYLDLKSEEVRVFEKADKNSKVVALTPQGLKGIHYDFYIESLTDNKTYYHVLYSDPENKIRFSGYIHQDDVVM